ncbi:MAG: Era Like 12S Mitochondrial RRNA Chaperone 1 [Marteilia pararefringens]
MPHFPALCRTLRRTLCHNKPPNVPQSTPPRIKASNSSIVPPDQQRILRVSIVGAANAGKSSLFNRLIQLWASAVSHCYNTTRTNLIGCCTRGRDQVVLVDTPGTSHPDTLKRHKIDPGILERPNEANLQCDMSDLFSLLSKSASYLLGKNPFG